MCRPELVYRTVGSATHFWTSLCIAPISTPPKTPTGEHPDICHRVSCSPRAVTTRVRETAAARTVQCAQRARESATLIFGRGRGKDACARQAHTLNEHVTESIRKKQKMVPYMAVVLVAATCSSLPYYSRQLVE